MKIMGFVSVVLALFLISFSCNIKLSTSKKNGHSEGNFITIPTNYVNQRSCTCAMPSSCSCCEIVKIFYTGDERRLCFNMVYQRNGLNFDLALDSTIIKSMTVANYRPFRMCASVPGLPLTSICVNVLDLNQLARSVIVCPRLEVSTKIQRWHISYTCQNVSTDLPAGIAPLAAAGSAPVQVMVMPGMIPVVGAAGLMTVRPPTMGQASGVMIMGPIPSMMPSPVGGAVPPKPAAPLTMGQAPGVVMMTPISSMMPTAAGGAVPPKPAAPGTPGQAPAPGQQMMPIAGMMLMGMRPAAAAMIPAPSPPATPGAVPSVPPTGAQQPPAATPSGAPAAQPPPAVPTPPGATPPMIPPGMIVPRPANGLVYSMQPLFRTSSDDSADYNGEIPDGVLPAESISVDSTLISSREDQTEPRSLIETDTEPTVLDNEEGAEFTTQPVLEETAENDQESTIEDATETITESERAESGRILNRKKRQYDIFDIFQQSNRCDRAYRICITRSNNYIVSRLRNTRFNSNKNKDMDCNDRPTKIVHGPGDNLCSYLTTTIANDSGGASVSFDSNSNTQSSDTLDAIIVHDDSEEDSDFYTQHYPQTASITPYNRPRVFPLRTPPLVASQLKEHLKNLTNETLIISRM